MKKLLLLSAVAGLLLCFASAPARAQGMECDPVTGCHALPGPFGTGTCEVAVQAFECNAANGCSTAFEPLLCLPLPGAQCDEFAVAAAGADPAGAFGAIVIGDCSAFVPPATCPCL